jgi:hypothetical protein
MRALTRAMAGLIRVARATLVVLVLATATAPALAQGTTTAGTTAQDGIAAMDRGDFQAALPIFEKLGEAGDTRAMVTVGSIYYRGRLGSPDYSKAYDWFLRAYRKGNGDAVNNIGVLFRDGLGVKANRQIAYLLFLNIHMTGAGGEANVIRANGNLRREMAELPLEVRDIALCWSGEYVNAYVEAKGELQGIPEPLRTNAQRKAIRDFDWWRKGELAPFTCPKQE